MGGARKSEWDDGRESRCDDVFMDSDEESSDELDDPQELDLEAFGDDNGDEEKVPCPNCQTPIWEHAERCSACGEHVAPGAIRIGGRGLLVAGVLVGAMLVAAFFLCR